MDHGGPHRPGRGVGRGGVECVAGRGEEGRVRVRDHHDHGTHEGHGHGDHKH